MMYSILVLNPNSSESVTSNLADILPILPGVEFSYYTAPAEAPKEISGTETSIFSERVVLNDMISKNTLSKHDGILICCYSDHPLIHSLSKITDKPILGIMQATILYSLSSPSIKKSFILTSFKEWEPLLDQGIIDFVGSLDFPCKKFQHTKGLDVSVLSLNDPKEYAKIYNRVHEILNEEYKDDGINCVLLGCAGMAGLDSKLKESFPEVEFVDSCKIGVEFLYSLIRFHRSS